MHFRCEALRNISENKLIHKINSLKCTVCQNSNTLCKKCSIIHKGFTRYYEANIPVRYWTLEMNNDFSGDKELKKTYDNLVTDIPKLYREGKSMCFAGWFGIGKTMVCSNIIKRVIEKGFSGLYVTLPDIISAVTSGQKYDSRSELISVDFLVIDEFDPRYMGSDNASDFFGRVVEDILRTRFQNDMPTFICTNSTNLTESFQGILKESISSIMNEVKTVIVLGEDHRKKHNG